MAKAATKTHEQRPLTVGLKKVYSVTFSGNPQHNEKELAEFEVLLRQLLRKAKIGGDVVVSGTTERVRATGRTKGLAVSSLEQHGKGVPLLFHPQSGNNTTRYKYYLAGPPEDLPTICMLLKKEAGTVYQGEPEAPSNALVTEQVKVERVESRPTSAPVNETSSIEKPTEKPVGGYLGNEDWKSHFFLALFDYVFDGCFVRKEDISRLLAQMTHYEQAFQGYGAVLGQLSSLGYLVKTEQKDVYRIEVDNPKSRRWYGDKEDVVVEDNIATASTASVPEAAPASVPETAEERSVDSFDNPPEQSQSMAEKYSRFAQSFVENDEQLAQFRQHMGAVLRTQRDVVASLLRICPQWSEGGIVKELLPAMVQEGLLENPVDQHYCLPGVAKETSVVDDLREQISTLSQLLDERTASLEQVRQELAEVRVVDSAELDRLRKENEMLRMQLEAPTDEGELRQLVAQVQATIKRHQR